MVYERRDIRLVPLPAGKGYGEQWVRQGYLAEVIGLRRRAANTALIVAIDADTIEVEQRRRQLDAAASSLAGEKIVHLIPKRNIETWILCLKRQPRRRDNRLQ